MSTSAQFATKELSALFAREVTALGGSVKDVYDDGHVVLARSVLPRSAEIQLADRVHGGVALRAQHDRVHIHPYTFREVCRNGAILSESLGTRSVELDEFETASEAEEVVVEAIRECAEPGVFSEVARRLREACDRRADLTLNLLPLLGRMPREFASQLLRQIMDEFQADRDASRYGLFNAVTAVARQAHDPQTRWRLEEFGGNLVLSAPRVPVTLGAVSSLALANA